jgi:chemotaxis protein CheC
MTAIGLSQAGQSVVAETFSRAMKRAGEAMGAMSGQRVEVETPVLSRCTATDVLTMAGGPEAVIVAIYVTITGSLKGHAVLFFSPADARHLANVLMASLTEPGAVPVETHADPLAFDEVELSALQEAGNVTISAFLNELGMHLHEPVSPTPPQIVVEMAGAILDTVLLDLVRDTDQVLAVKTVFRADDRAVDGSLLVLPRTESLPVLLDALGALGI